MCGKPQWIGSPPLVLCTGEGRPGWHCPTKAARAPQGNSPERCELGVMSPHFPRSLGGVCFCRIIAGQALWESYKIQVKWKATEDSRSIQPAPTSAAHARGKANKKNPNTELPKPETSVVRFRRGPEGAAQPQGGHRAAIGLRVAAPGDLLPQPLPLFLSLPRRLASVRGCCRPRLQLPQPLRSQVTLSTALQKFLEMLAGGARGNKLRSAKNTSPWARATGQTRRGQIPGQSCRCPGRRTAGWTRCKTVPPRTHGNSKLSFAPAAKAACFVVASYCVCFE